MTSMSVFPNAGTPSAIFSGEVRALMGRHQVTQAQLADVLNVTPSQMSKRLRGVIPIDINEIAVLAEYFGVSIATLFGETSTAPNPGGPGAGESGRRDSNSQHSAWKAETLTN